MNLAAFRSRAARVSGMSTTDSGDLALIDAWVNDAVEQFLKDTKLNVLTASLAVTAGEGDYTLDTDILSMQALWFSPAADAQSALMVAKTPEDIYEMRFNQSESGPPVFYALLGAHTLLLHPEPDSSSDTLHLLYVPRHTTISTTGQSPSDATRGNIPTEYHVILEAYVKWKACEAEEHRPSENGVLFMQQYQQGVAMVKGELKKKAGVNMPSVRLGHPRRYATGNGVDYR